MEQALWLVGGVVAIGWLVAFVVWALERHYDYRSPWDDDDDDAR